MGVIGGCRVIVRRTLSSLFRVVLDEANRNPDFEASLRRALSAAGGASQDEANRSKQGRKPHEQHGSKDAPVGSSTDLKRSSNRRPPAVLDPVQIARDGEQALRTALSVLHIDQLHDIVADFGMDPGKLVMKWRTEKRVIERIVEISLTRARKGDAFRGQNIRIAADRRIDFVQLHQSWTSTLRGPDHMGAEITALTEGEGPTYYGVDPRFFDFLRSKNFPFEVV